MHFYFQMHANEGELEGRARVGVHEWLHAWIGVRDEYKKGDGTSSACPGDFVTRTTWDACIMAFATTHSELCRKENHNPQTLQGEENKMSCYEWMVKVAKEDGKAALRIPEEHLKGPDNPPDPAFEVKW